MQFCGSCVFLERLNFLCFAGVILVRRQNHAKSLQGFLINWNMFSLFPWNDAKTKRKQKYIASFRYMSRLEWSLSNFEKDKLVLVTPVHWNTEKEIIGKVVTTLNNLIPSQRFISKIRLVFFIFKSALSNILNIYKEVSCNEYFLSLW